MVDTYQLAHLPAVRVLGEVLRERLGVWCGLLDRSGAVVPIGAQRGAGGSSLCSQFKTRLDAAGSCAGSVRLWGDAVRAGQFESGQGTPVSCHAGLSGLVWPIQVDNDLVCTLYITGFWSLESVEEKRRFAARRLKDLSLPGMAESGFAPVVGMDERGWLDEMAGAVIREIEAFVLGADRAESASLGLGAGGRRYGEIIGRSEPMMALFQILNKVVTSDSTVLIQGENGTGKELIARAVHYNSRRRQGSFVVQNCSALNDNLLDSELFGHKRGSFTGAVVDKQGLFDLANMGTFFLDEVGDMSPTLQVKLLRVLQEGTFVPVGDTVTRKVDVRIIAATNRDLKTMVAKGTFREDLYYRLNVINLVAPPVRERRSDIPLLVDHFLAKSTREMSVGQKSLSEEALGRMLAYRWPGNIRELENEVERLVVLAGKQSVIGEELLSRRIQSSDGGVEPLRQASSDLQSALETLERRMLLEGLRRTNWNKTRTAKELGISRRNLIRKVDRYELDKLRER